MEKVFNGDNSTYRKFLFNEEKLSTDMAIFAKLKVCIVGSGAVGSYLAEQLAKMGVGSITLIDYDKFSVDNVPKHSSILRTPEDFGKNKAKQVAKRLQAIMPPNGRAYGIDANLVSLDVGAFFNFDFVVLAVDNYAAKIYFNGLWKQIPKAKRPILIFGGTNLEMAESYILDGEKYCLHCTCDESWLVNPLAKTSCSGPQYLISDGVATVVPTSGLASSMSAHLMSEQLRACALLTKDEVMNKNLVYHSYPCLSLDSYKVMPKVNCPHCKIKALNWQTLAGDTSKTTLEELFQLIDEQLIKEQISQDYILQPHILEYANMVYSGLITNDYCHHCGDSLIEFVAHESRVKYEDVLCEHCQNLKTQGLINSDKANQKMGVGTSIYGLKKDEVKPYILQKTLFELGWPVGAPIFVTILSKDLQALEKDMPKEDLDKVEIADFLNSNVVEKCFMLAEDANALFKNDKITG